MVEKNLIADYSRVSSAAQSLELQLSAARRYLESQGLTGNEDFVIELSDHDVSATKLKMKERPKLMELIRLIQEGKVKKVIAYKRDRFARNFYEFVDITRIFIKYNVEVVYTASNEPPFRNKLALEAFYGMFGQMEGENIRTRTSDARKQYPSSIFGYKRMKEEKQVYFVVNDDKRDSIVSLFTEFSKVKDEEQFFNFLMARRKGLKPEKLLRILTNPFYAAYYESKNGMQPMAHVEPMISLELYRTVTTQMDEFLASYKEKLIEVSNLFIITPKCGKCGNEMKHRKQNTLDEGYFVCSANHKRMMITAVELNVSVKKAVLEHVQSLYAQLANRIMSKHIASAKNRLEHAKDIATSDHLDCSIALCTLDQNGKSAIPKYLDRIQMLKDTTNQLGQDLVGLQLLSNEIKSINKILSQQELPFSQHEVQQLMELLVHEVLAYDTYIGIDLFLSSFVKDINAS